jgi:hypothetical protein
MYVAFFYGITLLTEIGVEDRCGFLFYAGSLPAGGTGHCLRAILNFTAGPQG